MTEYEYVKERFCPSGANENLPETIDIPENATGVSLSTWGDPESSLEEDAWVTVMYLVPVEDEHGDG